MWSVLSLSVWIILCARIIHNYILKIKVTNNRIMIPCPPVVVSLQPPSSVHTAHAPCDNCLCVRRRRPSIISESSAANIICYGKWEIFVVATRKRLLNCDRRSTALHSTAIVMDIGCSWASVLLATARVSVRPLALIYTLAIFGNLKCLS